MSFKLLLLAADADPSWPEKIRRAVPGTACGVSPDRPTPSPIPMTVRNCFSRAAKARIAYIRAYRSAGESIPKPSTATAENHQKPARVQEAARIGRSRS